MLNIAYIRDNKEVVQKAVAAKGIGPDIDELIRVDDERKSLLEKVEALRQERNQLAAQSKSGQPTTSNIEKGKQLKEKLVTAEAKLDKTMSIYDELMLSVPNVIPDDTPLGSEADSRQEKQSGDKRQDKVIDHLTWGEKTGLIDFERGAKVAGNKFYYLKGALVELEAALNHYVLQEAIKAGFTPMTVPHMVSSRIADGTGFVPRGEEQQVYKIDGEDLNLIATAEMPITGYHADEVLEVDKLPLLYAGISPSYRMEAGAYGKHSKGLYRVHQFNKIELYVFCKPEDSEDWHQKLLQLEEQLVTALEIPYRIIRIAAGDLGAPAYKKYDIEYWSPVDQAYRELMSCSNVTDFQSRRLNIRWRDDKEMRPVHTLNGTAMAFSRTAIALIENHQTSDGNLKIPKALQAMFGREVLLP